MTVIPAHPESDPNKLQWQENLPFDRKEPGAGPGSRGGGNRRLKEREQGRTGRAEGAHRDYR